MRSWRPRFSFSQAEERIKSTPACQWSGGFDGEFEADGFGDGDQG